MSHFLSKKGLKMKKKIFIKIMIYCIRMMCYVGHILYKLFFKFTFEVGAVVVVESSFCSKTVD